MSAWYEGRLVSFLRWYNRKNGTTFSMDPKYRVGTDGKYLVFDPNSRKACLFSKDRGDVFDFTHFRNARLRWKETCNLRTGTISLGEVYLEIEVNDPEDPIIVLGAPSMEEGKRWLVRIEILLGW